MDHLGAIRTFIEITDQGSLTRAAETLDLSRAMVSRHLESLERWLGARLLHRTTRRVSLSEAGVEALPRLRQMLDLAADLQAVSGARRAEPQGKLRITTSLSFAIPSLTQAIVDFQRQYPRIEIELVALDRAIDLVGERIDLAVRVTNRLDDGVVARRLASCRSVLCASPAYLKQRGQPQRPEDLKSHDCITHAFGARAEYRFSQAGRSMSVSVKGPLSANETTVLRQAAVAGAGIAMLPTYFVVDELLRGTLVRVLPDHEPEPLGIHAVYLSRQHQPLPLKLLIDFLAERFGGDVAPWDKQLTMAAEHPESQPEIAQMPIEPTTLAPLASEYTQGMTSIRGRRVQRLVKREFTGAEQVLAVSCRGVNAAALLGLSESGAAWCATDGTGKSASVFKWEHGAAEAVEQRFDLHKDSLPSLGTERVALSQLSGSGVVVDESSVPALMRPWLLKALAVLG